MALKIVVIAGIIVFLGLGLLVYHAVTHPGSVALPSWLSVGSSSAFSFSLSSMKGPSGPTIISQGTAGSQAPTVITAPGNSANVINPNDIPKGYTLAQLSPYFHEVRIGQATYGTTYYYGTIALDAYQTDGTSIDITGWQIKTRQSGEYIPTAINLYDPSGLTQATDIFVKDGDVVSLYSTSAPFNIRINKCIGYIANVANFSPALPGNCPAVDQSQVSQFTGACENYIYSLGSCQAPNMTSPNIPRNDYACQDYLENNFNYKSCFDNHVHDADFLSNQVDVWMGANVVDQYHDSIQLLDKKGLLVDLYTY